MPHTGRAVSDVSVVGDPATGVAYYDSASGWGAVGGTGVASSIVAAMYALSGPPRPGTHPASYPYAHQANMFDVVSGSTGNCPVAVLCKAGVGWDGPTGLGSPNGTAAFVAPIAFGSGFEASGPALSWTNTVDGTRSST
jgi:hypothetical protein